MILRLLPVLVILLLSGCNTSKSDPSPAPAIKPGVTVVPQTGPIKTPIPSDIRRSERKPDSSLVTPAPAFAPTRTLPTPTLTPLLAMQPTPTGLTPSPVPSYSEPITIPTPQGGTSPEWQRAVQRFFQAYALQLQGLLPEAVDTYKLSISAFPTAEAYTFLGWTHSWIGLYDLAIDEAKKAIELDPDYGNPYNDIGVYLIEKGQLDEAIPWLEKAMTASRYASPHFPHRNLAGIWVRKGLWDDALAAFEAALLAVPQQPLPPLPTLAIPLPEPSEEASEPSGEAQRRAVSETMESYMQAWNAYDPGALMERSAPPSVDAAKALLSNLAYAKLNRWQIHLLDIQIQHLSERIAILLTRLELADVRFPVTYLLAQHDGDWKVVALVSTHHSGVDEAIPLY